MSFESLHLVISRRGKMSLNSLPACAPSPSIRCSCNSSPILSSQHTFLVQLKLFYISFKFTFETVSCLSERLMSRIILLSSTSENSFVRVHFISTFFFFFAISLSTTFLNSVTIVKKTTTILIPLAWPIPKIEKS